MMYFEVFVHPYASPRRLLREPDAVTSFPLRFAVTAFMRATISEVARQAGVSAATVDRVINNRPGVKARTREIVFDAARRLGYLPTEQSNRHSIPVERIRLDFVLPIGTNSFIRMLLEQLSTQGAARPELEVQFHAIEGFNPDKLAGTLRDLGEKTRGVGVVALDHPTVREAIRVLSTKDVKVVTLATDVLHVPRVAYVGIDNRRRGDSLATCWPIARYVRRATKSRAFCRLPILSWTSGARKWVSVMFLARNSQICRS